MGALSSGTPPRSAACSRALWRPCGGRRRCWPRDERGHDRFVDHFLVAVIGTTTTEVGSLEKCREHMPVDAAITLQIDACPFAIEAEDGQRRSFLEQSRAIET